MEFKSSAIAITCSALALTSCLEFTHFSGPNATIVIQPQIKSIPVGTTQTFTAETKNAVSVPIWSINGNFTSGLQTTGGTFVSASSDPASMSYTAPGVPPVYTDAQIRAGAIQGSVSLSAAIIIGQYSFDQVIATETFVVLGPVSVGLSPPDVSVSLGGTQQFTGSVVGSLNTALLWQVNSVAGGGTTFGSISPTGMYTAPTAMPVTGKFVTITAVSEADPTKSASSGVSLNSP
jgi:hypothetical protein